MNVSSRPIRWILAIFLIDLCSWLQPWWLMTLPALILGFSLSPQKWKPVFFECGICAAMGFLPFLLMHDIQSGFRLSFRIGAVLGMPSPRFSAYIVTLFIPFLICGLAGALGNEIKSYILQSSE